MTIFSVVKKPDDISWDVLAKCQQRAHESNIAHGVNMQCSHFTADELKNAVKNGVTLVALDGNGILAGMLSIVFKEVDRWWHKGLAAYICYVAVAPEFQGCGVYRSLSKKSEEMIVAKGVNVEYLHTHINNKTAQKAYEKDGYNKVRFSPGSGTDYYSVEMAKWFDGKGKGRFQCVLMYITTKYIMKILYKPGKLRRF